jgi:hypothetical protein
MPTSQDAHCANGSDATQSLARMILLAAEADLGTVDKRNQGRRVIDWKRRRYRVGDADGAPNRDEKENRKIERRQC